MNIQQFDFNMNLLRSLLWEHNTAAKLESLVTQKNTWYDVNYNQFWQDFLKNVFDLRTANDFGLQIWARILGIPLSVAIAPDAVRRVAFGFGSVNATTFARASNAWYVDYTGVLREVAANVPRYAGSNSTGFIKETAAQNIWSASYDFSTGYTLQNASSTTAIADPSLGTNATRITSTLTGSNAGIFIPTTTTAGPSAIPVTAGQPITMSVFVRAAGGNPILTFAMQSAAGGMSLSDAITVNLVQGTFTRGAGTKLNECYMRPLAGGWYRIGITITPTATGWAGPYLMMQNSNAGDSMNVYLMDIKNQYGISTPVLTDATNTGARAADTGGTSGNTHRNFNNGTFGNSNGNTVALTSDQQRLVLQLRYFQLVSSCSVTDINRALAMVFKNQGQVYVLDGLNMHEVIYVFNFAPGNQLQFLLENYDILPRPSTVGVQYRVVTRKTFGFNQYHANFNNGNFASDKTGSA